MSSAPFDVVRISDPAIDRSDATSTDWTAFFDDRDPSRLRYLTGASPMVFHCRVLSQSERREVMNLRERGESTYASRERAFAYGLINVKRHVREDGGVQDWVRNDAGSKTARPLTDAALANFGINTIDEIGGVVEARSFLDRDQPLCCPLLPTSHLAFQATGRRRAAQTSASADHSPPSNPPLAATPLETPPSSPGGGASGPATATANPI